MPKQEIMFDETIDWQARLAGKRSGRLKHHHIRALLVSKSNRLEDAAALAAGNLTFIPQSALEVAANLAIAAFQRYAAVRTRRGLLPKRSERLESLNIAPRLLGLCDLALHAGKAITEEEVVRNLKR
jgi:hypothetical protein